jgi:hypothetical protein
MADEQAYRNALAAALAGQYKPSSLAELMRQPLGANGVPLVVPTIGEHPDAESVERRSNSPDAITNALASYMRSNGKYTTINALCDSGLGAGSVLLGATMGLSPSAIIPYGHALYRGARAVDQFHDASDYYKAGSMWDKTGMPALPKSRNR